jgi:glyoxylase-like metal-dependent hydrolase (beta-lactamase superfamily II)
VVVLSHLHFDHAGGLLSAWREGEPRQLLFPNATFVVSAACWERACEPHPRDRASFIPELMPLLEASGRLGLRRSGGGRGLLGGGRGLPGLGR